MNFFNISKNLLLVFLSLATCSFFSSCGNDLDLTNYKEKLIGEWELKNVGDLQMFYQNRPFLLKNASMTFNSNGTLQTKMQSSSNSTTWIVEEATWSVTQSSRKVLNNVGETLTIKSNTGPFDDNIAIEFTDERTFYLTLNDLEYQFIKI
ncbi:MULTISPECIES: hypothetical protein [unclassified Aureispira]|uniref:hypothetical protein n=1 Tax=unclassified Aureispira TaxID=2649989 RepID=UPI00069874D7|nr:MULTISPECIES: hypothetical protein [unclassified Aureispira]WMX13914.1 hypothetical protein QP953_23965 [Aureispira sp. CCB-E]